MVEWKKIEDLGIYFGGLTGKTKEDFEEGNGKFITYMNVYSNPSLNPSLVGVVKINEGEKQNKVQRGDILFTGSSETPEETGMSCVVTDDLEGDFYMNSFCFGLRLFNPEQYNLHYFKHLLRSESVRRSIAKTSSGVTRFNISKARFGKIIIPIPPLSEQTRIVGILDTFTSSIENLKQQIAERRKQYEHYRDQLLDLEGKEGVEVKTLESLCDLVTKQTGFDYSKTIKPSLTIEKNKDSIPFIQNKDFEGTRINLNTDFYIPLSVAQNFPKILLNDKIILISISGRIGNVGLYDVESVSFVGGAVCVCRLKSKTNGRYLLYFLLSKKGQNALFQSVKAASHANITVEDIRKIIIPVPSPQEQSRIVSILDTFEASIANLEAQLELREKQYEYYRNQLLTFD